jgi:hypothetical protein
LNAVTSIGEFRRNELPTADAVQDYFLKNLYEQWPTGGWLVIYGACNTSNCSPENGRVDIWLSIYPHPLHRFYLSYAKTGPPKREEFHSMGDPLRLGPGADLVEIDDNGYRVAEGLFVSPQDAWVVVKHFIETNGERSDAIPWLADSELPESSISSPFSE